MPDFAEPLARLIQEFKRLPGIGQKSAQRLAFHVLRSPKEDAERLVEALLDVKTKLGLCRLCNNISDSELCPFCTDPHRDRSVDLRRRGAAQHRFHRDDAPVFGPVPRAPRSDFAASRGRAGPVEDQESAGAAGKRRGRGRSFWPPIPTWRARRRRPTWPGC